MSSLLTNGLFYYYIKNNRELMNNDNGNKEVIHVVEGFNIIFECKKCEDVYQIQFKNRTNSTRSIDLKEILDDAEVKCTLKCLKCNKLQYDDFIYKFIIVCGAVVYEIGV